MHPWFKDVDWSNLARSKAAFIPMVQNDTDTSYFDSKKPVSAKVGGRGVCDSEGRDFSLIVSYFQTILRCIHPSRLKRAPFENPLGMVIL